MSFSDDGEHVAAGDKAGMVCIFRRSPTSGDYERMGAFRSHEPEFDYLKSLEIEEKINKIRWLKVRACGVLVA